MSRKDKNNSILKSKRFKYGTTAIVFTVVFVAAVIALNVIFTSLAQTYMWYVDMTKSQLYTVSDEMRVIMDDLDPNTNIEFVFCAPFDQVEENLYQKQVLTLMQNLEKEYDFVKVSYIDIITNPSSAKPYKTTEASTIKTTNIIITNGSDYRVHTIESFYTFAESDNRVFAFNGEYKIISAILQLQGEKLIAYFTTNHGEKVDQSALWSLFEEAGFDVRKIDLTKEDIDERAKIVIINGAKYDFWGVNNEVNEIKKLDNFIDTYGSLMIFLDPDAQKMPELEELMYEWGIAFDRAIIKDLSSAVSVNGTTLVAEYPTEGLGASIHSTLRTSLENPPMTIVNSARPMRILDHQHGKNVTNILTTSPNAVAYSVDDDSYIADGPFDLMVISAEMRYVNNEEMFTYVVAGGTSSFGDTAYLTGGKYGNRDILHSIMKSLGKEKVPIGLDFKVYEDTSLEITTAQATQWTVIFSIIMPAIVAAAGVVIWARRRHL
jgi:ABC-type uncharacterized transport system.